MRKLVLQRDDLCRACARPLERGVEGWWDAQRRAAEWVLGLGGKVEFEGGKQVSTVQELPTGELRVTSVKLYQGTLSSDDSDLLPLRDLRHLSYLQADGSNATPAGIAGLEQLPALSLIHI